MCLYVEFELGFVNLHHVVVIYVQVMLVIMDFRMHICQVSTP